MNELVHNFGFYIGISFIIVSVVLNFLNKDRYKTTTDIFQSGNQELREQNATLREEKSALEQEVAAYGAKLVEKESHIKDLRELNAHQPDFTKLIAQGNTLAKQMSANHRVIMKALTDYATKVGTK